MIGKFILKYGYGSPGHTVKSLIKEINKRLQSNNYKGLNEVYLSILVDRLLVANKINSTNLYFQIDLEKCTEFIENDLSSFAFLVLFVESDSFRKGLFDNHNFENEMFNIITEVIYSTAIKKSALTRLTLQGFRFKAIKILTLEGLKIVEKEKSLKENSKEKVEQTIEKEDKVEIKPREEKVRKLEIDSEDYFNVLNKSDSKLSSVHEVKIKNLNFDYNTVNSFKELLLKSSCCVDLIFEDCKFNNFQNFGELESISSLSFINCNLNSIDDDFIFLVGSEDIYALDIKQETRINNLDRIINIQNINHLGISNGLTVFPDFILKMVKLNSLDLAENNIKKIPIEIKSLTNLQSLYLDHNVLNSLPKEIGFLSKLEILTLNSNPIENLPEELKKLELVELWISYEKLPEMVKDSFNNYFGSIIVDF